MKVIETYAPLAPLPATTGALPVWVFAVSLLVHGLVILGVLQSGTSNNAPPHLQAVIIDLIIDKSGASPDKKTQSEPRQKAAVMQSPSSSVGYEHMVPEFVNIPMVSENEQAEQKNQPQSPSQISSPPIPDILRTNTPTKLEVAPAKITPSKSENTKPFVPSSLNKPDIPSMKAVEQKKRKIQPSVDQQKPVTTRKPADRPKRVSRKSSRNVGGAKKRRHASRKAALGAGQKYKGTSPGAVTQGVTVAGRGLSNPRPSYPARARAKGYQGRVLLVVIVDKAGRARSVRLRRSSGHAILDRAAITAVKKWRFRPARKNGRPVRARLIVPVNFRLRG